MPRESSILSRPTKDMRDSLAAFFYVCVPLVLVFLILLWCILSS